MSLYFDNEKLFDAEGHLTDEGLYALKDGTLDPISMATDTQCLNYQIPGGMLSNLISQLKSMNAIDKLDEALAETPKVRADLGYPPLVTPTSQMVGSQAVQNVLAGERYKVVGKEIKPYCRGEYGRTPAPIDPAIRKKILGDTPVVEGRFADTLEPEFEKTKKELTGVAKSDEDVLSYIAFPQVATAFFKDRAAGFPKKEAPKAAPAAKPVEAPKAAAVEAPKAEAADFVKVENVFVAEDFASRDEALSFVSNQAVKAGIAGDADAVMNAFLAREAEGTTGMMEGFAIPHAKSDAITDAAVIVVKDDSGVTGWDTMDGAPVNVAIALLIPGAQAGTTHLKILSKVAEALMDEGFRATVKGSTDAAEIAKTINARLV